MSFLCLLSGSKGALSPSAALRPIAAAYSTRLYATEARKKKKGPAPPSPEAISLETALPMLRACSVGRDTTSLTVHIHTHLGPKAAPLRGSIALPRPPHKESVLAVFAEGKAAEEARAAGADLVLGAEDIPDVASGKYKFARCVAHTDIFPAVAKIARWLGPRGLMPTVKRGTVGKDMAAAIQASRGAFEFKADKAGNVRTGIAQLGWTDAEVEANIRSLVDAVKSHGKQTKSGRKCK
ncbi:ribosomal protein L1-like protein [Piptocephalis cylindrospora]|uniref:Ribosomal protein n=1 Tax=Piptocephalis cylindrospora TaxID=1907219 RepID=A0A4P9Y7P2_9FUNG|nr:ribosomal protein L1-like protein [Piptocephalis cylindrospora]|eukprot:RKP15167.1 ribosomal protein L1-like protein [Piptocephalis cylindrospora]